MAIIISTTVPKQFLLNLLARENILVKGIKEKESKTTFSVSPKDYNKLKTICPKANVKYEVVSDNSFKVTINNLGKRIGLIAGLIIFLASLVLYSSATLKVEIVGNNLVSDESIMQELARKGLVVPTILKAYDYNKIKKTVLDIEGISAASVQRKGSRILVNVLEEIPKAEIVDTQNTNNIVSIYNSIITKIVSIKGTPQVKIGDTVRANDILIAPYIQDLQGGKVDSAAVGEVFGRVWFSQDILYADNIMTAVRTGKKEVVTNIEIFGARNKRGSSFANYQAETTINKHMAIIPFNIYTTTYYETRDEEQPFDFEGQKAQLIEKGYADVFSTLPSGGKVLRKWYLIKRLDKMTQLSIYYEVDISIGKICQ